MRQGGRDSSSDADQPNAPTATEIGPRATASRLHWRTEYLVALGDVEFDLVYTPERLGQESTARRFVLQKSRGMLEWYERGFSTAPGGNVLEIGIYKGGSVAFFDRLLKPHKMVAIDISKNPVAALQEYITHEGAEGRLRPYYGVDQTDAGRLRAIILEEFGAEGIDLVIDDGCHLLDETRASFDAVFPYVRVGGAYVIEDWGWAHWSHPHWQEGGGPWKDHPATTQVVFELVMLAASRPDIIESVVARSDLAAVVKGNAPVPNDFRLAGSYLTAGRRFGEISSLGGGEQTLANPNPTSLRRALSVLHNEGPRSLVRKALRRARTWYNPRSR